MKYKRGRPKGYVNEWNPRKSTLFILDQVEEVLQTYKDHWPLTVRQIFYRLVGIYDYEKTDRAYRRLVDCLVMARRSRRIPFDAIRDDGLSRRNHPHWKGVNDLWSYFEGMASTYTRDKRANQPYDVFLLCEAGGMVPQLARVARPYSVPVMSSGGFDSLTVKYEIAMEVLQSGKAGIFLHVGDYDPSGVCIFDSLAADVEAFSNSMAVFQRVALTPEQIKEYNLPTAPAKKTDKRGNQVKDTCQAEALPPDVLAEIVDVAIKRNYDMARLQADLDTEKNEADDIIGRLIWGNRPE